MTGPWSDPDLQAIDDIACADPAHHERMVGDFLTERMALFTRIAVKLCRRYGLPVTEHRDDVTSIVTEHAWTMVADYVAHPDKLLGVGHFAGLLYSAVAGKVRSHAHSESGHAPAAGMAGVLRRRGVVAAERSKLADELGHEPSRDQLEERLVARYPGTGQPRVADFVDLSANEIADHHHVEWIDNSEHLLHPHEAASFISRVIDSVRRAGDANQAAVAIAWLGGMYAAGTGEPATNRQIADELALPIWKVRRIVDDLREFARNMIVTELGIEDPERVAPESAGSPDDLMEPGDGR
ncbi:hypothetical protein [Isoptericola croceus]|uniref:hypothetical protein n=1 Tax=Isoptericola croceus TaxID=3031406 RepID=UPI0023F81FD5|nr:hypothetical protein [Isoptericola croceus]